MSSTTQKHAYHYTARLGFALIPIPSGEKAPKTNGWQHNPITDPQQARKVWKQDLNMGLLHEASGTCVIDVDQAEWLKLAAEGAGLDLVALIDAAPLKIQGKNGAKPLFRVPDGLSLPFGKLVWPHPTERVEKTGKPRQITVVEFRCGPGKQDVLPPSIHPDTRQPYVWIGTPPRTRDDIPELPAELVALWENLPEHLAAMKAACPWDEAPTHQPTAPRPFATPYSGESVIDAYNARYTVQEELEAEGYTRRGGRYLSPHSSTKMAAVILYDDQGKTRARSYHGSDEWSDDHGHDAFDLFCQFQHQGDTGAAVRAARELLGMTRPEPLTDTPLTPESAAQLWDQHETDVLERAMSRLAGMGMNHNMREALTNLLAWIYHSAAEGNLSATRGGMALMVGGLKAFAAVIGGRASDCKARLEWLATHGMIGSFRAITPEDPNSGRLIILPANPLALPFLTFTPPNGPATRPQTQPIRREKVNSPPCNTQSKAKAGGGVNVQGAKNPLRALLSLALTLSKHPGVNTEKLAEMLGVRLQTARKWLSQLGELGYLTGNRLSCTFQQFFADMRAWGAEQAGRRLGAALHQQAEYARRGLMLGRLGVQEFRAKAGRMRRLLETSAAKLDRLSDGEMPHMVLGRAA